MRGRIRERGAPRSWEYIVDIDMAAMQRCQSCNRRHWIERRPKECQVGIRAKVVSERLGHATISITLDTYLHAIPATREEAAAPIAGLAHSPTRESQATREEV